MVFRSLLTSDSVDSVTVRALALGKILGTDSGKPGPAGAHCIEAGHKPKGYCACLKKLPNCLKIKGSRGFCEIAMWHNAASGQRGMRRRPCVQRMRPVALGHERSDWILSIRQQDARRVQGGRIRYRPPVRTPARAPGRGRAERGSTRRLPGRPTNQCVDGGSRPDIAKGDEPRRAPEKCGPKSHPETD